jgi:hypothetical protein
MTAISVLEDMQKRMVEELAGITGFSHAYIVVVSGRAEIEAWFMDDASEAPDEIDGIPVNAVVLNKSMLEAHK